jgi:hypothetical protein
MLGEDELCGVCPHPHAEKRPATIELALASPSEVTAEDPNPSQHGPPAGRDAKASCDQLDWAEGVAGSRG